jgi:hypothetical protein
MPLDFIAGPEKRTPVGQAFLPVKDLQELCLHCREFVPGV